MQELLWAALWLLVRRLLNISKELTTKTLELVAKAQELKYEDGSPYDGKREI